MHHEVRTYLREVQAMDIDLLDHKKKLCVHEDWQQMGEADLSHHKIWTSSQIHLRIHQEKMAKLDACDVTRILQWWTSIRSHYLPRKRRHVRNVEDGIVRGGIESERARMEESHESRIGNWILLIS